MFRNITSKLLSKVIIFKMNSVRGNDIDASGDVFPHLKEVKVTNEHYHNLRSGSFNNEECTNQKAFTLFCQTDSCWTFDNETSEFLFNMNSASILFRKATMMEQHSGLRPSDRACLLDWLMELCEFFQVSRDTYYQCLDYIDRYFTATNDICKDQIQLIGISCLYLASKQEDVPKIQLPKLLFLTDGLYTTEDVIIMEKLILEAIGWRCSIWNVNKWLFMLLHLAKRSLSAEEFLQLTDLLDLVTIDIESLEYSYSVLASACLYLVTSVSIHLPGNLENNNSQTAKCISWMRFYWNEIKCNYSEQTYSLLSLNHNCKLLSVSVRQHYSNVYIKYKEIKKKGKINTK